MKKVIIPALLALGYVGIVSFSSSFNTSNEMVVNEDGKALFEAKCTMCHRTTMPKTDEEKKAMKAPPIFAVMNHVKYGVEVEEGESKRDKMIDFIFDYTQNPSKDKSFCEEHAIERFGVMPSQKENVTPDELTAIANYLCDEYAADAGKSKKEGHSCGSHDGKGKSCKGGCKH